MADSAEFVRKPINMKDLKEHYYGSFRCGFEVEKIAELSREQFEKFSGELYGYYRFLYDNRDAMYMDPGDRRMHCILVTTSGYREGILIEAEGYAYPRYAAFMPDCRKIDLEGKEVLAQADLSPNLPMEYWREASCRPASEDSGALQQCQPAGPCGKCHWPGRDRKRQGNAAGIKGSMADRKRGLVMAYGIYQYHTCPPSG